MLKYKKFNLFGLNSPLLAAIKGMTHIVLILRRLLRGCSLNLMIIPYSV